MTNSFLKAPALRFSLLTVVFLTLFSYHSVAGGEHFKVFLNKKLVGEQFVHQTSQPLLSLQLDQANYNDEITIAYTHCGAAGKQRVISAKDDKGNILKQWKFTNTGNSATMVIKAKDILDLKKQYANLQLSYKSAEIDNRVLVVIKFDSKKTAG